MLSIDQESNSFVPVIGLNKAADMTVSQAMMHAWNGCPQLRAAVDEDDMGAIASGALLHFRNLTAPDPHNISEDEAASAHVYTQETHFFRHLNEHLRGTDRSKIEPYKPFLKLLVTALHKIPPSANILYRGVAKSLSQLPQKFEKGKSVVWWAVTSTASHVSVLENPMFMGKSGPRCLFTIKATSARDIQRYSAMGSTEREFVLPPGSCFVVEDILDAGSGLTIVQLVEDASMKLLKFELPSVSSSLSSLPESASTQSSPLFSSAAVGGGASRSLSDLSVPDVALIVSYRGAAFEGYSSTILRNSFGGDVIDMLDMNDVMQLMEGMGIADNHKLVLKAAFAGWKKNPEIAFQALAVAKIAAAKKAEEAAAATPTRSIVYNGIVYKSLADHDPHSLDEIREYNSLYNLDSPWRICPKTADALLVCASYPWATFALVFADGSAHCTALGGGPGGYQMSGYQSFNLKPGTEMVSSGCLKQQGGQHGIVDVLACNYGDLCPLAEGEEFCCWKSKCWCWYSSLMDVLIMREL